MSDIELQMQQLRAEYRQMVAADLGRLHQLATSLRGDEQDRGALESMAGMLHRIAGGAGVFGMERLSERARELELDVNDWLGAPLGAAYYDARTDLLSIIMRLLADADA